MAKRLKLKPPVYAKVEEGTEDGRKLGAVAPDLKVQDLSAGERCALFRRRCGMTQAQVAALYGSCKTQVQYIEQGKADAERLEQFWRAFEG